MLGLAIVLCCMALTGLALTLAALMHSRRRAVAALNARTRELEHAYEELRALQQRTHDIRQPLKVIGGYDEIILPGHSTELEVERRDILLVEDNADEANLAVMALQKQPHVGRVHVVTSADEALEYLSGTGRHAERQPRRPPSLVLLDLKLPGIEWQQVLRQIRRDEYAKHVPVVVLTSSDEPHDRRECYLLGATSYVLKPLVYKEFVRVVASIADYWLRVNAPAT